MKYPTVSLHGQREKGIVSAVDFSSTDYTKFRIAKQETIHEIWKVSCNLWIKFEILIQFPWSLAISTQPVVYMLSWRNLVPRAMHVQILCFMHTSQVAHQAGAYPGFCSMKWIGVFLLLPGWDASPFMTGLAPALHSPVPIYTPGWREPLWELRVLPRNNTVSQESMGTDPLKFKIDTLP